MSETSVLPEPSPRPPGARRAEKKRRSGSGCLPMLVFVVVTVLLLAGAGWFVVKPWAEDLFAEPEDYPGPGEGEVCFEVMQGDTISSVGDRLVDSGVVASSEAFADAAEAADAGVFAGTFGLREEMRASDAVDVLSDMGNEGCISDLTLLPGKTVKQLVALLAKNTEFSTGEYERVLRNPEALGLPEEAGGNAEGYLAPGSYEVGRDDNPRTILRAMVDRWRADAEELDLEGQASDLGYSAHEVMTVASLVEAEGATVDAEDKARIARVIYNRLENPGTAGQAGFLQIDATVDYALGRPLTVGLTQEERETTDSPYNTYLVKGLPPGPIAAPSDASLEAALNPAEGDWYYYVTVNLKTGETKFAESYDEFLQYEAELRDYCETQSQAC